MFEALTRTPSADPAATPAAEGAAGAAPTPPAAPGAPPAVQPAGAVPGRASPGGGAPGGAADDPNAADPPPGPGPAMWCSDCRTPIRTYYYALITRPLCATCKPPYAARISRGTGAAAFGRAVVWGSGAALGGAVGLALIIQFIGFGRLIAAVGLGWVVAKAIGAATADLGGRRYQILAVTLTYFAIGLGSILPVVVSMVRMGDQAAVEVPAASDDRRGPFEANSAANEIALYQAEAAASGYDLGGGQPATDPMAELAAEMEQHKLDRGRSPEELQARELRAGSPMRAVGALLILMLTLPLIGMLAYGLHGAALGIFSLGFGMLKAWRLTDEGIKLTLTGPHRVGTGPVAATF